MKQYRVSVTFRGPQKGEGADYAKAVRSLQYTIMASSPRIAMNRAMASCERAVSRQIIGASVAA